MADFARDAFELESGICYLNAAAITPIPRSVSEAGTHGVLSKGRPWLRNRADAAGLAEEVRRMAGAVVGAEARNMAIINSVSYGIATACKAHRPAAGSRLLVLAGEHTSLALGLADHAATHGCTLEIVEAAPGLSWTDAVLAAIDRPGAPPVSLAGLTPLHWTDGALVDIGRIAPALKAQGAALLVDATQAAGVMPIDVAALDPDWLIFPTYKWLLGPYNLAFLYVASRHLSAAPLEQHIGGRMGANSALAQNPWDLPHAASGNRFDMGERDNFATLPMAAAALRFLQAWHRATIAGHLRGLTTSLAQGLASQPIWILPEAERAPHILGIKCDGGFNEDIVQAFAERGIVLSVRRGVMRVSPYLYNGAEDVDRFCAAFRALLGS